MNKIMIENQNTLNAQNVIIFNGDYHNSPCLKERLKKLANFIL